MYRILGDRLQLLHKTAMEDVPLALCEFHGRLLVGECPASTPPLRQYDSLFMGHGTTQGSDGPSVCSSWARRSCCASARTKAFPAAL